MKFKNIAPARPYVDKKLKNKEIMACFKEEKIKTDIARMIPAAEVLKELYGTVGKSGTVLRGLRTREGLTQEQFAQKVNCPQSWISGWETGKRALGKKMALKIAKAFKVDYRVLL